MVDANVDNVVVKLVVAVIEATAFVVLVELNVGVTMIPVVVSKLLLDSLLEDGQLTFPSRVTRCKILKIKTLFTRNILAHNITIKNILQ